MALNRGCKVGGTTARGTCPRSTQATSMVLRGAASDNARDSTPTTITNPTTAISASIASIATTSLSYHAATAKTDVTTAPLESRGSSYATTTDVREGSRLGPDTANGKAELSVKASRYCEPGRSAGHYGPHNRIPKYQNNSENDDTKCTQQHSRHQLTLAGASRGVKINLLKLRPNAYRETDRVGQSGLCMRENGAREVVEAQVLENATRTHKQQNGLI